MAKGAKFGGKKAAPFGKKGNKAVAKKAAVKKSKK